MGLGPLAGVGHVAARRRGTTSTASRGSAPSRPAFDLHHPHAAPAGTHAEARASKESSMVSALGPADIDDAGFVDDSQKTTGEER